MSYAKRLRELRKACGYTQKELADRAGISIGTVGVYEQGRRIPKKSIQKRLSCLFCVPMEYFFEGTEKQGREEELILEMKKRI